MIDSVLLFDKPVGWSSFDVVAKVRTYLKQQTGKKVKVGHAGTLDPMASGLLVVLTGKECKNQNKYMKQDKTYEVTLKLGVTSSTDDSEGEKKQVSKNIPTENEVINVIKKYEGEITQTPPIFSAIKINGQRAYKLARQGKNIQMEPRRVTIYSISGISYKYPEITFTAKVSSGTYIRSLARDIGEKLGVGAYLSILKRTSIGRFELKDAQQIDSFF